MPLRCRKPVAHIVGALAFVTSCSGKVTASDSRIVETFEIGGGTVELESSFEAGISKDSSSGKWGLGSCSSGRPFGAHIGKLVIDTVNARKTVELCRRSWSRWEFPGIEDNELPTRLEESAAASFRDREPQLERCVHESRGETLLLARCRIEPEKGFGNWVLIRITHDRRIIARSVIGAAESSSCDQVMAEHAFGR